ncbi:MAG: thiamine pyrophosphate-dependent dehydrogenase E1 component subunit alpha [Clostridiaceae bacterium]|nr:thiamine pyrophosphate-dependent dehydrogenase E1 component subunit alpha [Clostridiaceae bacterium]
MSKVSKKTMLGFYKTMVRIRYFEEKVEEKFLAGEIPGFIHLYIGEEAIAAGVCSNLTEKDYIESTHRGHGHCIAKGADIKKMMAEIFGKKTGYCKGKGGSMHIADFSIGMLGANGVVGGGYNLAAGAALAEKLKGTDTVSVVFFGDGASNRGTFHEALNLASIWKLPVIFVNENNEWASTTPYDCAISAVNVSDRAVGYNIPGARCDGNDVFAVYETAKEAISRARRGEGPTLLEFNTLRVKGHYVGDPEKYRIREEIQSRFKENDPITRFEEKVLKEGSLTEIELEEIRTQSKEEVEAAFKFAMDSPHPDPEALYDDLYVEGGIVL